MSLCVKSTHSIYQLCTLICFASLGWSGGGGAAAAGGGGGDCGGGSGATDASSDDGCVPSLIFEPSPPPSG